LLLFSFLSSSFRFWNRRVKYLSDKKLNELALPTDKDYWQTPKETLLRGFGDCEDFAIAKFFTLRALGVDSKHIRLIFNYQRSNVAHMVLGYWEDPEDAMEDVLILDNAHKRVRPLSRRRDISPVYSFDSKGVYTMRKNANGSYFHKFVENGKKHSKWMNLFQRITEGQ
jgi:predicted transglutaminase-like cysteine proteinase